MANLLYDELTATRWFIGMNSVVMFSQNALQPTVLSGVV